MKRKLEVEVYRELIMVLLKTGMSARFLDLTIEEALELQSKLNQTLEGVQRETRNHI